MIAPGVVIVIGVQRARFQRRQVSIEYDHHAGRVPSVRAEFCLELGRYAEAELAAREAASLIHTRGYQSRMYRTAGALAKPLYVLAQVMPSASSQKARHWSRGWGLHAGRPQLLRARGRLLAALKASSDLARKQHSLVRLGTNEWPFSRGLGRRRVAWFGLASKASGAIRSRLSQSSPAPTPVRPDSPTSPRERFVISSAGSHIAGRPQPPAIHDRETLRRVPKAQFPAIDWRPKGFDGGFDTELHASAGHLDESVPPNPIGAPA